MKLYMNTMLDKLCTKCNSLQEISNFYPRPNTKIGSYPYCKSCSNFATVEKQRARKAQCVNYKGGMCFLCGYNRYIGSLDFHHLNPSTKDFEISRLRSFCFDKIKAELDKCILVCRTCHGEIHGGIHDLNALTN
jgi:hypothetical protein